MALTLERLREIERMHVYAHTATLIDLARDIEAEVRKDDDALIRQLVEALEGSIAITMGKAEQRNTALIAVRARLKNKL